MADSSPSSQLQWTSRTGQRHSEEVQRSDTDIVPHNVPTNCSLMHSKIHYSAEVIQSHVFHDGVISSSINVLHGRHMYVYKYTLVTLPFTNIMQHNTEYSNPLAVLESKNCVCTYIKYTVQLWSFILSWRIFITFFTVITGHIQRWRSVGVGAQFIFQTPSLLLIRL